MVRCGAGVRLVWVSSAATNTERSECHNLSNFRQTRKESSLKSRAALLDMVTQLPCPKKEISTYGDSTPMVRSATVTKRHIGSQKRSSKILTATRYQSSTRSPVASMLLTPLICLVDHTPGAKVSLATLGKCSSQPPSAL